MIDTLTAAFAGGLLGSAHCIGMCGGFAATLAAADRPFWPVFLRQVVYNLGRVFTYAFLGALAGASAEWLEGLALGPVRPQQAFSILAGLLMLAVALGTLTGVRLAGPVARAGGAFLAPLFAYFMNARGWWGYFAAGLANGFLPCGLVYAFLALAAAQDSPPAGMALMACFGLSTLPAMLLVGCGAGWLRQAVRLRVYRLGAVLVVVYGLVTLWRGLPAASPDCCEPAAIARRQ
jgi:sulfite exporter TauE/SafE